MGKAAHTTIMVFPARHAGMAVDCSCSICSFISV